MGDDIRQDSLALQVADISHWILQTLFVLVARSERSRGSLIPPSFFLCPPQVARVFLNIFRSVGLELYLYPYRVVPNRTGADRSVGGVIECVPNAMSRDEIGKANNLRCAAPPMWLVYVLVYALSRCRDHSTSIRAVRKLKGCPHFKMGCPFEVRHRENNGHTQAEQTQLTERWSKEREATAQACGV